MVFAATHFLSMLSAFIRKAQLWHRLAPICTNSEIISNISESFLADILGICALGIRP